MKYCFGDIVVVEGAYIGVIVKSWISSKNGVFTKFMFAPTIQSLSTRRPTSRDIWFAISISTKKNWNTKQTQLTGGNPIREVNT